MEKVAHLSDADSTLYIDFLDFRALIRDQEVGSKSANVERVQSGPLRTKREQNHQNTLQNRPI